MTYLDAKMQCESDGATLITPRCYAENNLIKSLFPGEKLWIGINDLNREGKFVYLDGSDISFTNWRTGEPNNFGDEDAIEIQNDGLWNDAAVHSSNRFICSRDVFVDFSAIEDDCGRDITYWKNIMSGSEKGKCLNKLDMCFHKMRQAAEYYIIKVIKLNEVQISVILTQNDMFGL